MSPRFAPEARAANLALVDLLKRIAETKKRDPGADRAGLAAGAEAVDRADSRNTKLHRLEENLGAAAIELTPDDLREIEEAASKITIQGARLPEEVLKLSGSMKNR